jgi:UDP-N-acetyl-D-mannosaminuronate dehydrogenase
VVASLLDRNYFEEGTAMGIASVVVVLGLGEIGKPLSELLSRTHEVVGVDVSPSTERRDRVDVMHICYPFEIADFGGETLRYIERFDPVLTIINSTVAVGTTRTIAERAGRPVVHSPILGKHARMLDELITYTKFIGAIDGPSGKNAAEHFESAGIRTRVCSSPEATELAKLTETTYFGLMIAWAQEVERYCDQFGLDYDEVVSFYGEVGFLPRVKYFPGVIGGHCVMPNIEILKRIGPSAILEAIRSSNRRKSRREARKRSKATPVRL